jgi:hypothetical protein
VTTKRASHGFARGAQCQALNGKQIQSHRFAEQIWQTGQRHRLGWRVRGGCGVTCGACCANVAEAAAAAAAPWGAVEEGAALSMAGSNPGTLDLRVCLCGEKGLCKQQGQSNPALPTPPVPPAGDVR